MKPRSHCHTVKNASLVNCNFGCDGEICFVFPYHFPEVSEGTIVTNSHVYLLVCVEGSLQDIVLL